MAVKYTFTGEFTLNELLSFKTVKELKEILMTLGLRLKGHPLKDDYVEVLSRYMLQNPQNLLGSMYYYELKACLDVIEGRMSVEYAERSGLLFELNRFGMIYATEQMNLEMGLKFCKEMSEVLQPLLPAEIERREKDGSLLAEKLALGCANLYGYTDMYYLQEWFPELDRRLGHSLTDEDINRMFEPMLREMRYGSRSDRVFMSPFCAYNGFKFDFDHILFGEEAKKFDFDKILEYGEMPYPIIKGREVENLRKALKKYGDPGAGTPDEVIRRLWIEKQDESRTSAMPDFSRFLLFSDLEDLQTSVGALVEFQNTIPYWRLRGNSSEEIGRKDMEKMRQSGQRPRITIGPNMRAMGIESFEQLEEMAQRGEDFPFPPDPFSTSGKKVGRNDPCPCGSGKKYKHCCGK